MLTKEIYEKARLQAIDYLNMAGIAITDAEKQLIQVAEYSLNDIENIGLELVVYVNTLRCCAKELILFPGQTCPEHRHPPIGDSPGKEETFRCRWGEVYLYVEKEQNAQNGTAPKGNAPKGTVPGGYEGYFTCGKEIVLRPGEQYTIAPDTLHWFQSGPEGAVVSEFSTQSRDEADIYTDPRISASQERVV